MTDRLISVPFQGATLTLIDHEGEPFAAMRPIVEGMGITWEPQRAKLRDDGQRWKCHDIVAVAEDGKRRKMICLPLRKLAGWLAGISVRKVKPEIRDRLTAFQEECDDALWAYWTAGRAAPPAPVQAAPAPRQADLFKPEFETRAPLASPLFEHISQHLILAEQLALSGVNAMPPARAAFFTAARGAAVRALELIERAESEVRHV
jgi:hypothetical protein